MRSESLLRTVDGTSGVRLLCNARNVRITCRSTFAVRVLAAPHLPVIDDPAGLVLPVGQSCPALRAVPFCHGLLSWLVGEACGPLDVAAAPVDRAVALFHAPTVHPTRLIA